MMSVVDRIPLIKTTDMIPQLKQMLVTTWGSHRGVGEQEGDGESVQYYWSQAEYGGVYLG